MWGRQEAEQWAPGARDWADYNEPTCTPFYAAVLDATVGEGTNLLDVGCSGGFAILLAALRGARVSGIDAVSSFVDIAQERVPAASLSVCDIEDPLPFEPGTFDVVTTFNSIHYVYDPVAAVKNMSQVTKPGGLISVVVWGPPEQRESAIMFREMGPLKPPPPTDPPDTDRLE